MNKARKALIRERDARQRLLEQEKVEAEALRLSNLNGGFSRSEMSEAQRKAAYEVLHPPLHKLRASLNQPVTRPVVANGIKYKIEPRYTGEMAEREQAAKQKSEQLKARVAPIGNKMGAQYLTDTDLEDFKAGKLRRRS